MTRLRPTFLAILLAATAVAGAARAPGPMPEGTWTSRLGLLGERVTFDLRFPDGDATSWTVDLDELDGLSRDTLKSTGAPLRFAWRSTAGRIAFEGTGRWFGRPSGTFRVEPSDALVETLGEADGPDSVEAWWRIVLTGIDPGVVRALGDAGYDPPDRIGLSRLATHGIDPGEIRSFARLEPRPSLDDLVRLHRHGVAASDADVLVDAGLAGMSVDDVVLLRRHGLGARATVAMVAAGVGPDSAQDMVRLRRNGLSGDDVAAYRAVPGRDLDVDALVLLRRHGVGPDVLAGMTPENGRVPTVDEVVGMVRHGVSPERYRGFLALGHDDVDDIVDLVRNGVDPQWIASLRDAGVEPIDADDLVRLRRHGVDASLVRRVADAGATDLDPDALIDAAVRGVDAVR